MSTLQENYILYTDKVISETQFRHFIRTDSRSSKYISSINSTQDMINILKNKGVLYDVPKYEDVRFNIREWWTNKAPYHKNDSKLQDDQIKKFDNINLNELLNGAEYEFVKGGKKDWDKAYKTAGTNLLKDPHYYLNKLNGIEPVKKRTDQMQPVKKDNLVDKDNAMKPATKGEKMPKSGISLMEAIFTRGDFSKFTNKLKEEDVFNDAATRAALKKIEDITHIDIKLFLEKLITELGEDHEVVKEIDSIIKSFSNPNNKLQPIEVIRNIKRELKDAGLYNDFVNYLDSSHSVNEFNYNAKKNNYKYFIVQIKDDYKKINEGFEYQEDAISRVKEMFDEQGVKKDSSLKVLTIQGCKKYGLDPNKNSDWGNYKWDDENLPIKEDHLPSRKDQESFIIKWQDKVLDRKIKPDQLKKLEDGVVLSMYKSLESLLKKRGIDYESETQFDLSELKNLIREKLKKYLEDKIPGGKGDKLDPKNVDKEELKNGMKHEMEHTDDPKKAMEIALDHLSEDPNYYTNLSKAGIKEGELDKKEYTFFAVKDNKIIAGFKDKSSSMEFKKDNNSRGFNYMSRNELMSKGIDPQVDNNWKKIVGVNDFEFSNMNEEDVKQNHLQLLQSFVKMNPKELAKKVLDGKEKFTNLKRQFVAKILGHHVAKGNKDQDVIDAFHELSDEISKNTR